MILFKNIFAKTTKKTKTNNNNDKGLKSNLVIKNIYFYFTEMKRRKRVHFILRLVLNSTFFKMLVLTYLKTTKY